MNTTQPASIYTQRSGLYSDHINRGHQVYPSSSLSLERRPSNSVSSISKLLHSTQADPPTSTQQSGRDTQSFQKHFEAPDGQYEDHRGDSPKSDIQVVNTRGPEGAKALGRQVNFTETELEQLSKSWLHVSQDAIIGKDRRGQTFWKSIADDYNARLKSKGVTTPKRTVKSLESRWSSLNKSMCKYASCVQTVNQQDKSGKAPADLIVKSLALYKSDTGSDFKDMVCYQILRTAPKWQDNPTFLEMCTPTKINNEHNFQDQTPDFSSGTAEGPVDLTSLPVMDRPMGNKRAKRARLTSPDSLVPQLLANSNSVAASAAKLVEEQSLQRATLQRMLEHSILMSNTNGLDDQSKADILAEKAQIVKRNCARRENQ